MKPYASKREADRARQRDKMRAEFYPLFAAVEELLDWTGETLNGAKLKIAELNKYRLAVLLHVCRGSSTAEGVLGLAELGLGEEALVLSRVVAEGTVSVYWMSLDAEARADQFERFARLELLDFTKFMLRWNWIRVEDVEANLRDPAQVLEVKQEFRRPFLGWTKVGWRDLVREVADSWEGSLKRGLHNMADTAHTLGSRHAHVGTIDTAAHLSWRDGPPQFALGATKNSQYWVPEALRCTAWFFLQTLDLAVETLLPAQLDEWRTTVAERVFARCAHVSRDIAKGTEPGALCPCGSRAEFQDCHANMLTDPDDMPS